MDGSGAAGPSLSSSRSPQFLSPLDCDCWAWIWTLLMALPKHPAPGMGLSTLSRPVPGLGSCWPLCLLGLLHLWPVLKLSSLLTFRCPPSTLGLSPCTVTQPVASLSPWLSYPKSILAGSCAWVRTITPAAPALGSAHQTPPLGPSVMSALLSSPHSLFGDVSSCLVHSH